MSYKMLTHQKVNHNQGCFNNSWASVIILHTEIQQCQLLICVTTCMPHCATIARLADYMSTSSILLYIPPSPTS